MPIGHRLVFSATGSAYFRIWIVNLLLTIVTVGIYSAWAKVRRLRYFYGNTLVDGSPFEFHGRPLALLKGRLVGLVLLASYSFANRFSVVAWIVVVVVLLALMPWLLWKSLRFRLANSSYRGIRFGFDGTIGQAYLTFVPLILMFVVPAFLALSFRDGALKSPTATRDIARYFMAVGVGSLFAPWFYFRLRAYQHRHARLGSAPFTFDGRVRDAYWIVVQLGVLAIAFAIFACIPFVFGVFGSIASIATGGRTPALTGVIVAVGALSYLIMVSWITMPQAMIQNYVWNHSLLDGERFASRVNPLQLWWIFISNLFLTIVTLGFWWPFGVVRTMRCRIEWVKWTGDPALLLADAERAAVGATGEETADLFGLDIAL